MKRIARIVSASLTLSPLASGETSSFPLSRTNESIHIHSEAVNSRDPVISDVADDIELGQVWLDPDGDMRNGAKTTGFRGYRFFDEAVWIEAYGPAKLTHPTLHVSTVGRGPPELLGLNLESQVLDALGQFGIASDSYEMQGAQVVEFHDHPSRLTCVIDKNYCNLMWTNGEEQCSRQITGKNFSPRSVLQSVASIIGS